MQVHTDAAGRSRGAIDFDTFIQGRGISCRLAAEDLGVSHVIVSLWRRGLKRPGAANRARIERWTGGEVRAAAWDQPARSTRRAAA